MVLRGHDCLSAAAAVERAEISRINGIPEKWTILVSFAGSLPRNATYREHRCNIGSYGPKIYHPVRFIGVGVGVLAVCFWGNSDRDRDERLRQAA